MNTKKIEHCAKKLNRFLIMGLVSTAMLGTLSGCRQAPKYANMGTDLTHREVFQSHSLNSLISNNFDDNIASDISNSDGRTAIFSPLISDSKVSKGNIRFDTSASNMDDSPSDSDYYSRDGSDDTSDSDTNPFTFSDTSSDKSMHNASDEPPVHYDLNKKKQILYIVVPQSFGSLKAIKYKLDYENTHMFNDGTFIFKPIRLWHNLKYPRKGYRIPKHVAKHNMLKLTHISNLKHFHHFPKKNKNSLNYVG